ncbi:MAG: beta-lactamase family protein [Alphaproteobacteria bacterium]|nr:beta-lactamase family protein [Alphaproteobacteria bacterium]
MGERLADGLATVPGSPGNYSWSGTAGTTFGVDPRLELAVVFMAQAPGAVHPRPRRVMRQLDYAALID